MFHTYGYIHAYIHGYIRGYLHGYIHGYINIYIYMSRTNSVQHGPDRKIKQGTHELVAKDKRTLDTSECDTQFKRDVFLIDPRLGHQRKDWAHNPPARTRWVSCTEFVSIGHDPAILSHRRSEI